MTSIQAVVTDLDGTILDEEARISAATLLAASCLTRQRIPLIVATARSPEWIMRRHDLVPWLTAAVCCDGAMGWSPDARGLLWREAIAPDVVQGIVRLVGQAMPSAAIAAYDGERWRVTDSYLKHRRPPSDRIEAVAAASVAEQPVCSLWISREDDQGAELPAEIFGWRSLKVTSLPDNLVGIGPAGTDKAVGVARVLADLGIDPAHTIVFGDMLNDLPVFALCGHRVAVANAHPDVLAAASMFAPCVHNDGFARTLCDLGVIERDCVLKDWIDPGCTCRFAASKSQ
jgi:hydroxymethylpyrimidine pyrophosphatase-like HAD family hydrolase